MSDRYPDNRQDEEGGYGASRSADRADREGQRESKQRVTNHDAPLLPCM